MPYRVGDITSKEPHPESPIFKFAPSAAAWIVAKDLGYQWWPLPVEDDAQPARLGGTP